MTVKKQFNGEATMTNGSTVGFKTSKDWEADFWCTALEHEHSEVDGNVVKWECTLTQG